MNLPIPSEEQMYIINHIKSGKYNGEVDAVAGSGKTTTILSLATHITDKSIIQITYNSELKREVSEKKDKYGLTNIAIFTYHSFAYKYYTEEANTDIGISKIIRTGMPPKMALPQMDILVGDEIQDMNFLYYQFVQKVLTDSGNNSRIQLDCSPIITRDNQIQILILGDKYQGLYEFKGADTRFLTLGHQIWSTASPLPFKQMNLTTSYRVTRQIADFVNKVMLGPDSSLSCLDGCSSLVLDGCSSLGSSLGSSPVLDSSLGSSLGSSPVLGERIHAVKDGPKVSYIRRSNCFQVYKSIGARIVNMILSGYAKPSDIFVLAASVKQKYFKMIENMLVENNIPCYVPMNDVNTIHSDVIKNKVIFSSFHQSKGRERKVVIIYGFDRTYFDYYNRGTDMTVCPSTLYVAATRATEKLIVVESADPLPFLKYTHYELRDSSFIDFEGEPVNFFESDINGVANAAAVQCHKTSPTELIRFLNENVVITIADLMEDYLFTSSVNLDLDLEDINNKTTIVSNENFITSSYFGNDVCEEVSDLNGLVIPSLYQERNSGVNTITEYVLLKIDKERPFYKEKLNEVDFSQSLSLANHLLVTNIYKAMNENLYFKLAQIVSYDWLSQDNVDAMFGNMDAHISEPANLEYEVAIIKDKYKTAELTADKYSRIDEFIERHMGKEFGILRMNAIVDAISPDTIWEFKCVEALTTEHRLQLLIYAWLIKMTGECVSDMKFKLLNIRTGEMQTLDHSSPLVDEIMVMMLKAKFEKHVPKSDEEFVRDCLDYNIKNKE